MPSTTLLDISFLSPHSFLAALGCNRIRLLLMLHSGMQPMERGYLQTEIGERYSFTTRSNSGTPGRYVVIINQHMGPTRRNHFATSAHSECTRWCILDKSGQTLISILGFRYYIFGDQIGENDILWHKSLDHINSKLYYYKFVSLKLFSFCFFII